MTEAAPDPNPNRMEGSGRDLGAADAAARLWGLIVLAVGVWFLADVTIGMDMPNVPWGDVWPLGLILIGLLIVVRGMGRRRT